MLGSKDVLSRSSFACPQGNSYSKFLSLHWVPGDHLGDMLHYYSLSMVRNTQDWDFLWLSTLLVMAPPAHPPYTLALVGLWADLQ